MNTEQLMKMFKENADTNGLTGDVTLGSAIVSGIESAGEDVKGQFTNLDAVVGNVLLAATEDDDTYTDVQKAAATYGAGMGLNYKAAVSRKFDMPKGAVSPEFVGAESADGYVAALEAFDGQDALSVASLSFAFNLKATKQSAFAEAFFPLYVLDPSQGALTVDADVYTVMNAFSRTGIRPSEEKFGHTSLIQAMYDAEGPLGDETTLVIPVLRASAPGVDASDKVLLKEYPSVVKVGDSTITTAPIKTGIKVPLLTISQTDEQLARGVTDQTESLDRSIRVKNLYIGIGDDDAEREEFRVNVGFVPTAQATPSLQGDSKDFTINLETKSIRLDSNSTKQVTDTGDAASALLANYGANVEIKLGVVFTGGGNYAYGDIAGYHGSVELLEVLKDGVPVPETDTLYQDIKADIDAAKIEGYDVEARVTNSNLGADLPIINVDKKTQNYVVPVRAGFRIQRTLTDYGKDDTASKINGAVSVAVARMNIAAVKSINNYVAGLRAAVNAGTSIEGFESTGIARYLVKPSYYNATINLVNVVDSRSSGERDADIKAALIAKIKRAANELNNSSLYTAVLEERYPGAKPTVIVGTTPEIASYLGDEIDLGVATGKVYTLPGALLGDRIIISFGGLTKPYSGEYHPMNSGVCGYRPEVIVEAVRTVGKSTSNDLISNPSFIHAVNLPVWGELTVTGIDAVTSKVTVNTHNA